MTDDTGGAGQVEPVGAPDIPLALALTMVQHGLKTLVDAERAKFTADALATWRETQAATTVRHPLGTISLSVPKDSIQVVDDEAYLDHVLATADPDLAIEVITRVRQAYQTATLAELTIADGQIVRKATGEVVDIPGVSIVKGADPSQISVSLSKPTKAAAEYRAAGWLEQLTGLALPAGDDGAERGNGSGEAAAGGDDQQ